MQCGSMEIKGVYKFGKFYKLLKLWVKGLQCGSMDTKDALDNITTTKLVCVSYNANQ